MAKNEQQPTFQAYAVTKREGQDDYWLNVGAAFEHQDRKGYNVILQAVPLSGKIVLRPPKGADADAPRKDNNARLMERRKR